MTGLRATQTMALVVGLVASVLLVGVLLVLGGWSGESLVSLVTDTDNVMIELAVGGRARRGRHRPNRPRAGARRVGRSDDRARLASPWAPSSGATTRSSGYQHPYPSVADVAYLVLPIATAVALLLLSTGLSRTSRTRLILDGLIVAGSFTIVGWAVVLDELWNSAPRDRLQDRGLGQLPGARCRGADHRRPGGGAGPTRSAADADPAHPGHGGHRDLRRRVRLPDGDAPANGHADSSTSDGWSGCRCSSPRPSPAGTSRIGKPLRLNRFR